MQVKDITNFLENIAPSSLQESYDNSGLLVGSYDQEVSKALITLDVTNEVVEEAIANNCDIIIAHHPIIFKGLKRLVGNTMTEKLVIKAIKNDINLYAVHTNLDNVLGGVNGILSEKLDLINTQILSPKKDGLSKVVVFCPKEHIESVQKAMFNNGAGSIGNYDSCSFITDGKGTFRALEGSNPFVGNKNSLHQEDEYRLEVIVEDHNLDKVVRAMINAHPYEEVAHDIYKLTNTNSNIGSGMIGELKKETNIKEYLKFVKNTLGCSYIKHNKLVDKPIKKVAICGGSGSFLIPEAARKNADLFITSDIKYHDYFEYLGEMTIADAGHFETEHPVKELIYAYLKKKFPNFALQISKMSANPISFL